MKLILKKGFDYTPDWNNNKKEKKEDQIVVHLNFLSGADFSELVGGDVKDKHLKEWLLNCESIKNLEINDKVITPEDVYLQPGLMDLYIDIKAAYNKETIIDKKK